MKPKGIVKYIRAYNLEAVSTSRPEGERGEKRNQSTQSLTPKSMKMGPKKRHDLH